MFSQLSVCQFVIVNVITFLNEFTIFLVEENFEEKMSVVRSATNFIITGLLIF